MAKSILILKLFIFCLLLLTSESMASSTPVRMYVGSSHFSWLQALKELPDHHKNWESEANLEANKKPAVLDKPQILISYPKAEDTDKLLIRSSGDKRRLRLADSTTFQPNKGKVTYFGLHHHNEGGEKQAFNVVLTMNDGSMINKRVESARQGSTNFAGFVVNEGKTIKQVEIAVPTEAKLSLDLLQWGDLSDGKMADDKPVEEKAPTDTDLKKVSTQEDMIPVTERCNLIPEIVQYQCDNDQWLFDIKVSSQNPRSTWWCSDDEDEQCASYDKIASYGYYSKSEKPQVKLVFTDQDQLSCSHAITVKLPKHCKNSCSYHYEEGKEVETCEVGGSLVTTTKAMPALSLMK